MFSWNVSKYALFFLLLVWKTFVLSKQYNTGSTTVYPKKYAHGYCFAVLCRGYTLIDFPISIRLTSLALWQSNDCPSASKVTLMNMDKYFMWIHYERLHNHNKANDICIIWQFLGRRPVHPHLCSRLSVWGYPLLTCLWRRQCHLFLAVSRWMWRKSGRQHGELRPGSRLNIKTVFPRYGDSYAKDKTVARPSYLWHGDPYTGKTTFLYWDGPQRSVQFSCFMQIC